MINLKFNNIYIILKLNTIKSIEFKNKINCDVNFIELALYSCGMRGVIVKQFT